MRFLNGRGYIFSHVKELYREYIGRCFIKCPSKDVILFTNNCLGGVLYHDWKMKFNSPTINLQMKPETFLSFCNNLPESLDWEITEVNITDISFYKRFNREDSPFPVGCFKGGEIYFQHYHSFNEAKDAWLRRSKGLKERIINGEPYNIVLIMDECSDDFYEKFNSLGCHQKLLMLRRANKKRLNTFVFQNMKDSEYWLSYQKKYTTKRFYQQFDFTSWVK